MSMHIIFPGPRTTIQDSGRLGYQNSGFAPSGFIDRVASRMANALVDNPDSEAVVEFCFMGPIIHFDEEVNLAVCGGDFGIEIDSTVFPANRAVHVPAGATVRITTGHVGIYGSLAIAGGLDIPVVMGSRSTNLRCGIGGYKGRALMAGDVIDLRHPEEGKKDLSWRRVPERKLVALTDREITRIRVIPGPQEDMFTEAGIRTFYESSYEVTSHSDRMGFRLSGPPVESISGSDILTDGIVNGSVQIPGTGEPIVMMADRQTTGGYAKIASVINVDIPLFAQLRPGQKVQFEKCSIQEAQRLIRETDKAWKAHRRLLDEEKKSREEAAALQAQQERELLEKQKAQEALEKQKALEEEAWARAEAMRRRQEAAQPAKQQALKLTEQQAAQPADQQAAHPAETGSRQGWRRLPLSERKKLQPPPFRWRGMHR